MTITAVVLAAGASRRFGEDDKLLADAGGMPVLVRVLRAIDVPPVADIVVVTRPEADELCAAVAQAQCRAPIRFVVNSQADSGLASSLLAGLSAAPDSADGMLVTPGDMAGLSPHTVARVLAAFANHGSARLVYAALADGSQRNPVIWPRRLWPRLASATGDRGGSEIIRVLSGEAEAMVAVPVADDSELADIDTPHDLATFLASRSYERDSEGG